MSEGRKVVHAFPGSDLPENPLQIEPRNSALPYHCEHGSVRLNEHDRAIHCAKCGAALDPFNFVLSNARTIQRAWDSYRAASKIIAELNDRIGTLKKEEKRLRAQVKRLSDKSGEILEIKGKYL